KHKRATRGLVTPNDLDRFRTDFNHIINTIKAETWWEACVRIADGESNLDIAHVYQKQNPYLGEPMTDQTPIERAGEALVNAAFGQELPEAPIDLAKAVLSSIDTNQLARVIHAWDVKGGPCEGPFEDLTDDQKAVWESAALAVKNWLTGKDQQ
ncbi:MAG TPA: hypothetical protein VK054_03910, partial [Beutenbergiaceae bacterium]|nr:hypothetical protein [Beutenbergiaceae bacterium]